VSFALCNLFRMLTICICCSLVHTKLKPYHCTYCDKNFTRNDHLRRHQQRVHGEETAAAAMNEVSQRFICQECKAIFTSSGHLRVHIENKHQHDFNDFLTHQTNQPGGVVSGGGVGGVAGAGVGQKIQSNNTNYVIVDGKKRPVCDLCNKSFSKKDHLTRHVNNLHAGMTAATFQPYQPEPQTFSCHICGKSFSRQDFLRRHLDDAHQSNHSSMMNAYGNGSTSEAPLYPVPHLGLFNPSHYENNSVPSAPKVIKSSPQKEHKCSICNKNFSRRYHLTRHQKSLHGGVYDNPQ